MQSSISLIALCLELSGCASELVGSALDPGRDEPGYAANDARCRQYASEHLRTHRFDKYWRDHEYYHQYRICMSNTEQSGS